MIKFLVHGVVHGAILNSNMHTHTHTHTHARTHARTHAYQISNRIISVLYNDDFKKMISRKKRLKFYNISVKNFSCKNIYIYTYIERVSIYKNI